MCDTSKQYVHVTNLAWVWILVCIKARSPHNLFLQRILCLEVSLLGLLSKKSGTIGQQLEKHSNMTWSNNIIMTSLNE